MTTEHSVRVMHASSILMALETPSPCVRVALDKAAATLNKATWDDEVMTVGRVKTDLWVLKEKLESGCLQSVMLAKALEGVTLLLCSW